MKIKDIRFFGDEVYLLKNCALTSEMIEKEVSELTYSGQGRTVDPEVENSNIPYFAQAFFFYVFMHDSIPNEKDLIETYVSLNKIKTEKNDYVIDSIRLNRKGIENRLLRSFPSLIRDFHFFKLCQESQKFESVKYSLRKDINEGIDLLIEKDGKLFCISLYTKTKRAQFYKNKKNKTRHHYGNCHHQVEMPINFNSKDIKKVSDFLLLTKEHMTKLEEKIKAF